MAEAQGKQPIPRWLQNAHDRYVNGTYCHTSKAGRKECEGKTPIDCSHWDHHTDTEAGFHLPYMKTEEMHSPKAAEFYDVTEARKNGKYLTGLGVKPGDKILFPGHVGKVISYDPNGNGEFMGSQSSTGPAVTRFGPWARATEFQMPTRFLRPKESTDPQGILRRNDYVIPRYHTR